MELTVIKYFWGDNIREPVDYFNLRPPLMQVWMFILIQCKPRLLRRAQSRWGFQRGEAEALPLVEHGDSNPVFDIT